MYEASLSAQPHRPYVAPSTPRCHQGPGCSLPRYTVITAAAVPMVIGVIAKTARSTWARGTTTASHEKGLPR